MRHQIAITALALFATGLSAKSLWVTKANSENGMYADRKATAVGDILTVQIDEEVIVNRSSSKTSSTNAQISQNFDNIVLPSILDSSDTKPSIDINPNESFSGNGSVSDSNLLEGRMAVMVVDAQPNGNLIVEGARRVKTSGETQYMVVKGIVRSDDVMPGNTVASYNILNASVEIFGEGDLQNAQTKGWIQRLIDATNVF